MKQQRAFQNCRLKRNLLIELLKNYFPISEEEKKYKVRMLDFIIKHENCFDRSLEIGHITASAWLINKKTSHALPCITQNLIYGCN